MIRFFYHPNPRLFRNYFSIQNGLKQSDHPQQNQARFLEKFQKIPVFSVIENITIPKLTDLDLINFDQYYCHQSVSRRVHIDGKKSIIKKIFKADVRKVLELKLGNDFQEIIRFLESRNEAIKDIELAYCLKIIIDQYRSYMPVFAEKYLTKIQSLIINQKIKFNSIQAIRDIFYINNQYQFLQEDALIQILDQYLIKSQHLESEIEKTQHHNHSTISNALGEIFMVFQEVCQYDFQKHHPLICLIQIRKILTRQLNHLQFSQAMELFKISASQNQKLFTEESTLENFDNYFITNYSILAYSQKLTVIKYFCIAEYKQCIFAEKFIIDLENNITSYNIDLKQFSTLIWQYNLFKFNQRTEVKIWKFFENVYHELIKNQTDINLSQKNHSTIIQVFGQSEKGSLEFWKRVQSILAQYKEIPYADYFTLLQNYTRLRHFDEKLINDLSNDEVNGKEFKYLDIYKGKQLIIVFETFITSYYWIGNLKQNQQRALLFLMKQIQSLIFQNDIMRKEILRNPFTRIRYIISLNMSLDLINQNEEKDKRIQRIQENIVSELKYSYRYLERKIEKEQIDIQDMLILLSVLKQNDNYSTYIQSIEKSLYKIIYQQINYQEIIQTIILMYQLGLSNQMIWDIQLNKLLDTPESFQLEDLIMIQNIIKKIKNSQNQEMIILLDSLITSICIQNQLDLASISRIAPRVCQNLIDVQILLR